MFKGPLCWQRHMYSLGNGRSREHCKPGDRRVCEGGCTACTPMLSEYVGRSWGSSNSFLGFGFLCTPSRPSWSRLFEATPSSSESSVAPGALESLESLESMPPLPPCPILASHLRVRGSFRAPVLPILHCYPEYPQNTISHALCSVHLKPFIRPHPAVFPEKSGVTALSLRTPL